MKNLGEKLVIIFGILLFLWLFIPPILMTGIGMWLEFFKLLGGL